MSVLSWHRWSASTCVERAELPACSMTPPAPPLQRLQARIMSEDLVAKLEPYIKADGFNETDMRTKSAAAVTCVRSS